MNMLEKEKRLNSLYGEYTDNQPCLPPCNSDPRVDLPSYIDVMDRIEIKSIIICYHAYNQLLSLSLYDFTIQLVIKITKLNYQYNVTKYT